MAFQILRVPMLEDNYAWLVYDVDTPCVAVIDPAEEGPLTMQLDSVGQRLDIILLTHHHDDHVAAAAALRQRYGARVIGAAKDSHRLPALDQAVSEGDVIALGQAELSVMEVPGHTRGHVAYYLSEPKALFCGDTLFSLGCGRLFEGTPAEMFESLRRLNALPADTQVCCGHEYTQSNARFALHVEPGNNALKRRKDAVDRLRASGEATVPTTLALERETNPFLRAQTVEDFARLRQMKDSF